MGSSRLARAAILGALLLAGCRPSAPLQVSTIQLGRALSSDNRIGSHTTVFRPDDTIFVSVLTDATGSGTIGVRWMYGDRLISEPSREVSYKGAAATEFHIQNSGGFPPGRYSVEAFLDGRSVGRRTFTVER
ncbi:MAG: hypothetical protein OEW19_00270 [Acidobacteriota bacterium]|nr:hypothetical protein [Acidobacteriota bacterium]